MPTSITPLDFAILGLLNEKPRTGYAVRKVFADTAMGQYSSSPGSIYPALSRLTKRGFVESVSEESRSTRPRSFFRLTRKGKIQLKSWLKRKVTRVDVARHINDLLLRFAFMSDLPKSEITSFLEELELEILNYAEELETYRVSQSGVLNTPALLAIDNGIAIYRAHAKWASESVASLRGKEK